MDLTLACSRDLNYVLSVLKYFGVFKGDSIEARYQKVHSLWSQENEYTPRFSEFAKLAGLLGARKDEDVIAVIKALRDESLWNRYSGGLTNSSFNMVLSYAWSYCFSLRAANLKLLTKEEILVQELSLPPDETPSTDFQKHIMKEIFQGLRAQGEPEEGSDEYLVTCIREATLDRYISFTGDPKATKGARLAAHLAEQPNYKCSNDKAQDICESLHIANIAGAHPSMEIGNENSPQLTKPARIILG